MMRPLELVVRAGRTLFFRTPRVPALKHRPLHCSCFLRNARVEGGFEGMSADAEPAEKESEGSLEEDYSEEQRDAILHTLNTASESELAAIKLLRGKKSSSIVQYREQHGPFLDLDSLVNVPFFQHKITVKVFDSILNPVQTVPNKERKSVSRTGARFIKPDINRERLEAANSIVSIVFGLRKLAWAHVDRRMTVLDWQQVLWHRFMQGAHQPHIYLEDISSAVSNIPKADFYVLEKPGISIQHTNLFPVILHLRTVEAMLYTLLDAQYAAGGHHQVLSMVRNAVGSHFDLIVGTSRTSGLEHVQKLILESVTERQPRIHFPQDMVVHYRNLLQSKGPNRNEEMADALLQAIAFYELVVF
ncbi:transcription elongation factor, mitochondrial [Ascaphus truei]|uniref:transcription elongation factor, mitochondrial n=1 Tax=Ascaphus truei TaxID=8439 RepID=UPI003F59A27B